MQVGVVINQPTTTVTAQPTAIGPERNWSSGICDCCDDCESCALTFFLGECYVCCCLSKEMGEHCCTPILVPDALVAYRTKMRTRYNIRGSVINDCCCYCWCHCCTVCQLAREAKYIKKLNNGPVFPKSPKN